MLSLTVPTQYDFLPGYFSRNLQLVVRHLRNAVRPKLFPSKVHAQEAGIASVVHEEVVPVMVREKALLALVVIYTKIILKDS